MIAERVPLPGGEVEVVRPPDAEALITEEAFEREEFLPYWAELWSSAVALAHDVSLRALRGKHTLELGCGLGRPVRGEHATAGAGGGDARQPQAAAKLERGPAPQRAERDVVRQRNRARPQLRPVGEELLVLEGLLGDQGLGVGRPHQLDVAAG